MSGRDPGFPGNGTPYRGVYFGAQPIVQAFINSISTYYGRAMDWRSRGWRPGIEADPTLSYRGYEPALQRFAGGIISPSAANVRGGLNQLLPGTTGLPGEPIVAYPGVSDARDLLSGAPNA